MKVSKLNETQTITFDELKIKILKHNATTHNKIIAIAIIAEIFQNLTPEKK
jgi:hypothetical protein